MQFLLYFLVLGINIYSSYQQDAPLFLTPYIQSGRIDEARSLSEVADLSSSVTSYSGLITVDEVNGAHAFFWFFPAAQDPENAPVLLWSEGGPGMTGLFSVFVEHGPFSLGPNGEINYRESTWALNHSIIYMDQPMDVGYSFIENEAGYVTWGGETGPNVYNFLVQFFTMFPELQDNDFHCSGVSYGGIYAPTVAHYIHSQNQQSPELLINLKGVLLETPWVDPVSQLDYGEYLYHVGLIGDEAREHFANEATVMKQLISQNQHAEAYAILRELLFGSPYGTYYENVTGLTDYYNILKEDNIDAGEIIPINEPNFRQFLHVGNLTFNYNSDLVASTMAPKMLFSVRTMVEDLLNWGYDVMMYSGQFDVITSHIGVDSMIKNLVWDGAEDFAGAPRKVWRVNNVVAGYAKSFGKLTQVMVRNAGHGSAENKLEWTFDLLNRFTQGRPF